MHYVVTKDKMVNRLERSLLSQSLPSGKGRQQTSQPMDGQENDYIMKEQVQ